MVSAKKLGTLDLSWFRPGPYVQQGCARGTILLCTGVPVVGRLQARRERRRGLQVPKGMIEASANIVGKTGSVQTIAIHCPVPYVSCPPFQRGGSPSFYRTRRGRFTGMPHYLATWGGMVYSSVEMTPVLANLPPVMASWRALYLNRGGIEGAGVVVNRGVSMRARGSRRR
jgi:hypothetical protein